MLICRVPSSLPVSSTGQAYCGVASRERLQTVLYEERGVLANGISQTQLASACLREAASAEAGAFLTSLKKILFHGPAKSFF